MSLRGAMDCVARASRAIDLGGTVRAERVSDSLARARAVMGTLGITRLANVTGLDHVGVPTWTAVRPLALSLTVSQGKGLTHDLARVSALMECIEIHHAEHFVPRGRKQTLRRAAGDASYVHPLLLPIRPDVLIDDVAAIEWTSGYSLGDGRERWVPRDCIAIDSSSARTQRKLFVGSSNGLASGNTHNEATLHAVCEVIERDQESFWRARKHFLIDAQDSRLRLESVTDPSCRWLLDRCQEAGLDVVVWHTTQEVPVPCFACTVFDRNAKTFYPQRASGSGCHPYRRIALSRAITEALQSRLTLIAGGRDDVYWATYHDGLRVDDDAGRAWSDALLSETASVDFDDVSEAQPAASIEALLDWVLAQLAAARLEDVVVVDLTQKQLGIPVLHVTVAGAEASMTHAGYTPGPRMQALLATRS
jgi:ribosomal protein S12 methylthiotransferase accessory factor